MVAPAAAGVKAADEFLSVYVARIVLCLVMGFYVQ